MKKDLDKKQLKNTLTPLQYKVTQENATEKPFDNAYWDNNQAGIYVDIVSGHPLFSSTHKFDSNSGWPSFDRPLEPNNIIYHKDKSLWHTRIEVRSKHGDSHLGHLFNDGPSTTTKKRYCINSAALRFIPKSQLTTSRYQRYLYLFDKLPPKKLQTAIFAGGCFWCMQPPFDKLKGVIKTYVGYTGGIMPNPTYKKVSSGKTLHFEAIRVDYDPNVISYEQLLQNFWHNIDPTTKNRQFCDIGSQYSSAIFADKAQQKIAQQSKQELQTKRPALKVVTKIYAITDFWLAEDYHQNYYKKNPKQYKLYYDNCGRKKRLHQLWTIIP